jgi:acetyl-CoA carboxylase biotin carboxyl carrier protein
MKIKEIRDLVEFLASTGLNEVNIETEEFKVSVKRDPDFTARVEPVSVNTATPETVAPVAVATATAAADASAETKNTVEIKSPMIGTFYRSANPETPPFINVGDPVSAGQTVCIVEAMKLFNEIESEVSGTVVKVLVENGTPVEYDQPLYLVEPS